MPCRKSSTSFSTTSKSARKSKFCRRVSWSRKCSKKWRISSASPFRTIFWRPRLRPRVAKIDKLTAAQRADFQGRVETAIAGRVYPAYQKLIDYFREILPKTTTDDGVWKLPDGDAYYAYCLHENTTTTLRPDEFPELGLREVARIEGEMRAILDANGFAGQPLGGAMDKLGKDPRFLYPNDDKGRADALARYADLIAKSAAYSSKELFLTTPHAKIEVRRIPEFKE